MSKKFKEFVRQISHPKTVDDWVTFVTSMSVYQPIPQELGRELIKKFEKGVRDYKKMRMYWARYYSPTDRRQISFDANPHDDWVVFSEHDDDGIF